MSMKSNFAKMSGFFGAAMAIGGPDVLGMGFDMPIEQPRRGKKGPAPRKDCNRNKWYRDHPRSGPRTPKITARRKANKVGRKSRQINRE